VRPNLSRDLKLWNEIFSAASCLRFRRILFAKIPEDNECQLWAPEVAPHSWVRLQYILRRYVYKGRLTWSKIARHFRSVSFRRAYHGFWTIFARAFRQILFSFAKRFFIYNFIIGDWKTMLWWSYVSFSVNIEKEETHQRRSLQEKRTCKWYLYSLP